MEDFFSYYDQVGNRPNTMVTDVVRQLVRGRTAALDLGCGNFRDSRWLKRQGFVRVVAVDPADVKGYLHDGIEFNQIRIEDFLIPEGAYDFIAACSVFHYLHVDNIVALVPSIMRGLRSGGVFSFNVLGERDGWIQDGLERACFTSESFTRLIAPYRSLCEAKELELTLGKKWHMFYAVLGNPEPA